MKTGVFISEPVSQVLQLYEGLVDEHAWTRTVSEQLELLADRLLEGHRTKLAGAAVELHNWLPHTAKLSTQELFDHALSLDDARKTVARAHGFAGWQEANAAERERGDPKFERAVEDLLAGDVPGLLAALKCTPDLIARRSHYGHRATLLHYLAANGVETYRQRVPLNAAAIAALLIQHGADVLATAKAYGSEQTVRSLLLSSGHPRAAGVTDTLLKIIDRDRRLMLRPAYLFGFGYEDSLEMKSNDETGSDYESSVGVFIEADSENEALLWGEEIAEQFMRHEHASDPAISWRALGYARWIEQDPATSSWKHCLSFFQKVRVGEFPDFSRMTSQAYVEWNNAHGANT